MRKISLLALLIFLVPTRGHASDVSLPNDDWRKIEIGDLVVLTDMKPKKAIGYAEHLTRLEEWLEIFAIVDPSYRRPRTLYLFQDHESLEPFLPLYEGKPANMAGFTVADFDEIFMALDTKSYEDPLTVLYHEFVHAFLAERAPRTPLWAQEGIAEIHTDFHVDGDYVVVGKRIDRHRDTFKHGTMLSEARLVSLDLSDPDYNESLRQSSYYAQAWATVHYLLTSKERRARFKDYLARIHEGQPEMIALYAAFGDDFPKPIRDLKPYVLQHDFPYFRLKRPAKTTAVDAAVSEIEPLDLHLAFGNLLLRIRSADDPVAAEHFAAALRMDPENPRALRGLAMVSARRENREEAEQVLERAVALPEVNAASSILLGSLLIEDYMETAPADEYSGEGDPPEVLTHAREQFELALSVEDSNPYALYGLGTSLYFLHEYDEAEEALEHAAEMTPWRTEPQRGLVAVHLANGNVKKAREVYEHGLKPLTRKHERYRVQDMLVQAEIHQANLLASRGEHTEAAMLLTEALRLAEGRDIVRVLNNALDNVATSETVQQYNRAISLLEDGEYAKATQILEELQSGELDKALRPEVDRLLEILARTRGSR